MKILDLHRPMIGAPWLPLLEPLRLDDPPEERKGPFLLPCDGDVDRLNDWALPVHTLLRPGDVVLLDGDPLPQISSPGFGIMLGPADNQVGALGWRLGSRVGIRGWAAHLT